MREIKVLDGNRCWLVCLTDNEEPSNGQILKAFRWRWNEDPAIQLQEATAWAADLLKDLYAQRASMIGS